MKYSGNSSLTKSCGEFLITEKYLQNVGSNVAIVGNANSDNGLNVNDWNRDNGNDNVRVVRLIVSSSFLWILSILQAFCLFLGGCSGVLNNVCFVRPGYLLQALKELLLSQALRLFVLISGFCFLTVGRKTKVQKYRALGYLIFAPGYVFLFWGN
ncbi:MAG: hypothetical protein AAB656_01460 [Patescibacteria group bacterium]